MLAAMRRYRQLEQSDLDHDPAFLAFMNIVLGAFSWTRGTGMAFLPLLEEHVILMLRLLAKCPQPEAQLVRLEQLGLIRRDRSEGILHVITTGFEFDLVAKLRDENQRSDAARL